MKTRKKLIIVIPVLAVLGLGGIGYTSRPQFCGSCHEMEANYKSWQTSAHRGVDCLKCHVDPGPTALAKRKIAALGELYGHFTGNYQKPIRARVNFQNCLSCHNGSSKDPRAKDITTTQGPQAAAFPHDDVISGKISCLECHQKVAHGTLPSGQVEPPKT